MIVKKDELFQIYTESGDDTPNSANLEGWVEGLYDAGFTVNYDSYENMFREEYPHAPVLAIGFHCINNNTKNENEKTVLLYRVAILPSVETTDSFKVEAFEFVLKDHILKQMNSQSLKQEKVNKLVKEFNTLYKNKVFKCKSSTDCLKTIKWLIKEELNKVQNELKIEQPEWNSKPFYPDYDLEIVSAEPNLSL